MELYGTRSDGSIMIASKGLGYEECYAFNTFELVNCDLTVADIMDCRGVKKVNVLSAISEGFNYFEICFDGKKKYFNGNMVQDIMMKIAKENDYLNTIFHFKSEDDSGVLINHILLVYPLGVMSIERIDKLLFGKGLSNWVDVEN